MSRPRDDGKDHGFHLLDACPSSFLSLSSCFGRNRPPCCEWPCREAHVARSWCLGPTASEGLGLPTARWVNLAAGRCQSCREMTEPQPAPCLLAACARPWARGTQLSLAWSPSPQKPWDNKCCFVLLGLRVSCYTERDNCRIWYQRWGASVAEIYVCGSDLGTGQQTLRSRWRWGYLEHAVCEIWGFEGNGHEGLKEWKLEEGDLHSVLTESWATLSVVTWKAGSVPPDLGDGAEGHFQATHWRCPMVSSCRF